MSCCTQYAKQYGPQPGDPILPTDGDTWDPAMPAGWTEVELPAEMSLGIAFEENEKKNSGVRVVELVADGSAAKLNARAKAELIAPGDQLVGVTGIRIMGGKYERIMVDARKLDFDTVVDAIKSNTAKYNCKDVILRFERPDAAA